MINRIKNKVKQIENKIEISRQLQEDNLALVQLLKMFGDNIFLPLTAWSVSPREVLHYCNDITINNRKTIVEFGSGFSTICIAQLLKISNKTATFISIENDTNWAAELSNILNGLGLLQYVKIIVAPITSVAPEIAKKGQEKWYDADAIAARIKEISNIDMVIVDGPFGGTTPFARFSAIPFLKEKMATSFTVFLDDTGRLEEKQIVSDWQSILGANATQYNKRYTCLTNKDSFTVTPYTVKIKL